MEKANYKLTETVTLADNTEIIVFVKLEINFISKTYKLEPSLKFEFFGGFQRAKSGQIEDDDDAKALKVQIDLMGQAVKFAEKQIKNHDKNQDKPARGIR